MNARTAPILACACAMAAAPGAAFAQQCAAPPSTAQPVQEQLIDRSAREAFSLLSDERQRSGAPLTQARQQRTQRYRLVAQMNWRWVCDHHRTLTRKAPQHAVALARGVVFFHLAGDRINASSWLPNARARIADLVSSGVTVPYYPPLGGRIDKLLDLVETRLAAREGQVKESYFFRIDSKSG